MHAARRAGAAIAAVGLGVALSSCSGAPEPSITTVTVTATPPSASTSAAVAPSTAAPSTRPATPIATSGPTTTSSPRPGSKGCAPNTSTLKLGFQQQIPDVDGDGKADVEFYTADRPLRFGVLTASGATITLADDLPGSVHHGTIGPTELGMRALIDDSATAEPFAFADCRFTRLLDASGSPYSVTLLRPAQASGTVPTGVVCTNLNGGEFVATARAAKRADGRWDVWWGILQDVGGGRYRADPLTGDPVFSDLPFSDRRVGDAFTSSCNGAPTVYWPDA